MAADNSATPLSSTIPVPPKSLVLMLIPLFSSLYPLSLNEIIVIISSFIDFLTRMVACEATQGFSRWRRCFGGVSSFYFIYLLLSICSFWIWKWNWNASLSPYGGVIAISTQRRRDRERVFLSTVIAEREEANVLRTEDGITILFRGFINTSRSCQNGVPSEVCQHFLVGFPHDWKKYSAHSFGNEDIDGVTAFGDSSACSKKRDDDALPFSIHDNDCTKRQDSILSNNCLAPKNICNGLGISFGNDSKQSESTDNMECSIVMKTMECECDNTASLNSSQLQVDIYNGEKGISDVAVESQAGNPKSGQSLMGMYDSHTCTGASGKNTVKPPISTKKMKKDQFSGDRKEKQRIRQKILLDASNSCSRMVTRSISKRSHTMPKEDDKDTVASVISPVRRSPRLYSCR
ncbi:SANT associated [Spatholobus suberectus]|nr:SANT associated [Spatholobus suberectus]